MGAEVSQQVEEHRSPISGLKVSHNVKLHPIAFIFATQDFVPYHRGGEPKERHFSNEESVILVVTEMELAHYSFVVDAAAVVEGYLTETPNDIFALQVMLAETLEIRFSG